MKHRKGSSRLGVKAFVPLAAVAVAATSAITPATAVPQLASQPGTIQPASSCLSGAVTTAMGW